MLVVNDKSGFLSQSPEVIITKNGFPFYIMKRKNRFIMFNMPAGRYEVVSGVLTKRNAVDYPLIELADSDFSGPLPKKLVIHFKVNPNKCSVDISRKDEMHVYFDNQFKNFPQYVIDWILGHEGGHYRYRGKGNESESQCDLFACNTMLLNGYNPSQIQSAIDVSLSNGLISEHRKEHVYECLQEIEKRLHNIKHLEHGW